MGRVRMVACVSIRIGGVSVVCRFSVMVIVVVRGVVIVWDVIVWCRWARKETTSNYNSFFPLSPQHNYISFCLFLLSSLFSFLL